MAEGSKDQYSHEETARRRDEVIKRMLNTPPRPRGPKSKTKKGEEHAARKGGVHRPKPRP